MVCLIELVAEVAGSKAAIRCNALAHFTFAKYYNFTLVFLYFFLSEYIFINLILFCISRLAASAT